jgi:NOL1/NOP2/fmu family ribosome biogenesis protein
MKEQFDAEFLSIKTEPSWGIVDVKENGIKGHHFYPHNVNGEGFFISVIRKNNTDHRASRIKLKEKIFQLPSKKQHDALAGWVNNSDENIFLIWRENILIVPAEKLSEVEFVSQNLHITSAGTTVAEMKHEKLVPEHAFAVSVAINREYFNRMELTKEQALQYLSKEALPISSGRKGFTLMMYNDIPLGWANVLDNRMNNLYPANWRIRMNTKEL